MKTNTKKLMLAVAVSTFMMSTSSFATQQTTEALPFNSQDVFKQASEDPNVLFYLGEKSYQKGDYATSLKQFLLGAEYLHKPSIENAKYMIQNNLGSIDNRDKVVDFLRYYAIEHDGNSGDLFAQIFLARYYSGDNCVWLSNRQVLDCDEKSQEIANEALTNKDLIKSYFYFELANRSNNDEAKYATAMMELLGLGVERNVPLALSKLNEMADKYPSVAYIAGHVLNTGYWVPMDKEKANVYLEKASAQGHVKATILLAQNILSGVGADKQEEREVRAKALLERASKSPIATPDEQAESLYRLAGLYATGTFVNDKNKRFELLKESAKTLTDEVNLHGVKALIDIGFYYEPNDATKALFFYDKAMRYAGELPLEEQQRLAYVYERMAYIYGRGQEGNLDKDAEKYGAYMNMKRRIMSKKPEIKQETESYQGYSAFHLDV
jgi:TPR repeat protein